MCTFSHIALHQEQNMIKFRFIFLISISLGVAASIGLDNSLLNAIDATRNALSGETPSFKQITRPLITRPTTPFVARKTGITVAIYKQ